MGGGVGQRACHDGAEFGFARGLIVGGVWCVHDERADTAACLEGARSFETAAKAYQNNPTALHLRAMNMLYEGLKEKGALMLIPSSAVESMGMGGLMGAAALMQKKLTDTGSPDGKA